MDHKELTRILDRTKSEILLGKKASFFGSILSSLNDVWTDTVKYAATDGVTLFLNPEWWLSLPMPTRRFVLKHELEHVARLHMLRRGDRIHKIWNRATDAVINQFLINDGESIEQVEWLINRPEFDGMAEEAVYEIMLAEEQQCPSDDDGLEDVLAPASGAKVINTVVRATQQAKLFSDGKDIPSYIQALLQKFLEPQVDWESVLHEWCTNLIPGGRTWKRPHRRYQNVYLPAKSKQASTLDHLMYFFDTSASVTDPMVARFNSEVKYIKETLNPLKLTLVQFDTRIRKVTVYEQEDDFQLTEVVGRGNTSLVYVRQMIEEQQPTAAIIFSDMECVPMVEPSVAVPILWAVIDNPTIQPPYGKILHIKV